MALFLYMTIIDLVTQICRDGHDYKRVWSDGEKWLKTTFNNAKKMLFTSSLQYMKETWGGHLGWLGKQMECQPRER